MVWLKAKLPDAAFNICAEVITSGTFNPCALVELLSTPLAVRVRVSSSRGVSIESLADFKKMIWGSIGSLPQAAKQAWAAKQAYIAFGVGIAAAALEEVDATPMEGFDSAKLDEALGLTAKGLKSAVILALGYRDEANDHYVHLKKVRKAKEDLFIEL